VSKRVEPPILLSRLLVFITATSTVVLGAMLFTLVKMFPLNRPQIFFLTTPLTSNQKIKLQEMPRDISEYKYAFIREYVRQRNEVFTNAAAMHTIWGNKVRVMSTEDVYADFAKTDMFNAIMGTLPDFNFSCHVIFDGNPMYFTSEKAYRVKFKYFCADDSGNIIPKEQKDYTVKIKLQEIGNNTIQWTDRIDNPLGLRISEYQIVEGDGDPLNTGFRENN
jgi:type IV secretory pathway component VirB8